MSNRHYLSFAVRQLLYFYFPSFAERTAKYFKLSQSHLSDHLARSFSLGKVISNRSFSRRAVCWLKRGIVGNKFDFIYCENGT